MQIQRCVFAVYETLKDIEFGILHERLTRQELLTGEAAMEVPTSDTLVEGSVSTGGVEKSVVFLFVGIAALVFFFLTIMGLETVQDVTTKEFSESGNSNRELSAATAVDIGVLPSSKSGKR